MTPLYGQVEGRDLLATAEHIMLVFKRVEPFGGKKGKVTILSTTETVAKLMFPKCAKLQVPSPSIDLERSNIRQFLFYTAEAMPSPRKTAAM